MAMMLRETRSLSRLAATAAAALLAGCTTLSHAPDDARPADFALVFFVHDRDGRNALYLLEPDRTLRVAVGADVRPDFYPPPTARLTVDQMNRLWSLTSTAPATTRGEPAAVIHEVAITANGRTQRTRTAPGPFDALLTELKALSGT